MGYDDTNQSHRDISTDLSCKMKPLAVLAFALACVAADVQTNPDFDAPIVKSDYEINPEGTFQYVYETGNGIYAQARGEVKNPESEYPTLVVSGGYKYTAPDGTPIEVTYVADQEGFKPVGDHIPVPPPIPEAIARSLAYIEAHPPKETPPVPPVVLARTG